MTATSEMLSAGSSSHSVACTLTNNGSVLSSSNIDIASTDYITNCDDNRNIILVCNNNRMVVLLSNSQKIALYTRPPTFLGLPAEIRNKIYYALFKNQNFEIMNWIPKDARKQWDYLDIAAITLVNKQCRVESLCAFRQHCNVYIPDVMAVFYTIHHSLNLQGGIFDANWLQKIAIDYVPQHVLGWPKLNELLVDFPQLRSLTVKCLIADVFDWRDVDMLEYHPDTTNLTGWALRGSLTNSPKLRSDLFGKMMSCKTNMADAVAWAEVGVRRNNRLVVMVRMRVYAMIADGLGAAPTAFGSLLADVRGKKLWYEGSGKRAEVQIEEWIKIPLQKGTRGLRLIVDA